MSRHAIPNGPPSDCPLTSTSFLQSPIRFTRPPSPFYGPHHTPLMNSEQYPSKVRKGPARIGRMSYRNHLPSGITHGWIELTSPSDLSDLFVSLFTPRQLTGIHRLVVSLNTSRILVHDLEYYLLWSSAPRTLESPSRAKGISRFPQQFTSETISWAHLGRHRGGQWQRW